MKTGVTPHGHRRVVQASVAAVASTVGVLALIAVMDVWPVLPDAYPTILAIGGVAAIIGAAWTPRSWYLTALLGAVFGFACAFGVATYAVSRI